MQDEKTLTATIWNQAYLAVTCTEVNSRYLQKALNNKQTILRLEIFQNCITLGHITIYVEFLLRSLIAKIGRKKYIVQQVCFKQSVQKIRVTLFYTQEN